MAAKSRTAEAPPHNPAMPSVAGGLWRDVAIIACLQALQFLWLTWRIDVKVALVNLLPTLAFFGAWTLFVNRCGNYAHTSGYACCCHRCCLDCGWRGRCRRLSKR